MRVVFMGTPAFAVPSLDLLIQRGFDVAAVVTQPDRPVGRGAHVTPPPVKQAALAAGRTVHQPPTLRSPDAIALLRSLAPDAIVVVAYGQILRRAVLDLPPLGCVNVHPSLLPMLRGASPIQSAIREGLADTGVTIMLMNERMDAGPILTQRVYPVLDQDTASTLGDRMAEAGALLLVETLSALGAGEIRPTAQDESQATYCKPLRKEDAEIDWNRSAVEIARACRAQTPWPGCQSDWKGRQVRFLAVEATPSQSTPAPPGSVYAMPSPSSGETFVAVATGDGALIVHELQLPGKRPLRASDFVRGQPGFFGSRLGSLGEI